MKSKIAGTEAAQSSEYPVLKRTVGSMTEKWDYVVLFVAPNKGVIVHVFKGHDVKCISCELEVQVGVYYEGFGEGASFEKYNGIIELSN